MDCEDQFWRWLPRYSPHLDRKTDWRMLPYIWGRCKRGILKSTCHRNGWRPWKNIRNFWIETSKRELFSRNVQIKTTQNKNPSTVSSLGKTQSPIPFTANLLTTTVLSLANGLFMAVDFLRGPNPKNRPCPSTLALPFPYRLPVPGKSLACLL